MSQSATAQNILQRIAAIHQERFNKQALKRQKEAVLDAKEKFAFEDTKIPEIWEAVKDIEIVNHAPEVVDGFTAPLHQFLVPEIDNTHVKKSRGIALYDRKQCIAIWYCTVDEKENIIHYNVSTTSTNLYKNSKEHPDAVAKFVDTFIGWLARRITPDILLRLGVDMTAKIESEIDIKPKRKISKVTEPA